MKLLHIIFIGKESNEGTRVFEKWIQQTNEKFAGQLTCKIVDSKPAAEQELAKARDECVGGTLDLALVLHPSVPEEVSVGVLKVVKELKQVNLRWIHSWIVGLDHIPTFLKETEKSFHQTLFSNARGAFTEGLVEFTFAGLLYFHRGIPSLKDAQKNKTWDLGRSRSLRGSTMAILGWGDIARAIGRTAKFGFNMRVLAIRRGSWSPSSTAQLDPIADEILSMDTLGVATCKQRAFSEGYCVVNTLPLTPETRKFCGAAEFALMSPRSTFVNVGRGGTVDEGALTQALQSKTILGAVLDVFEEEPLPVTSPLWELNNLVLSPHKADLAEDYNECALQTFLSNLKCVQAGATSQAELLTPVSPSNGY